MLQNMKLAMQKASIADYAAVAVHVIFLFQNGHWKLMLQDELFDGTLVYCKMEFDGSPLWKDQ